MNLIIITKYGKAIRFKDSLLPIKGRATAGLKAIQLRGKDQVRAVLLGKDNQLINFVTRFGKAKRLKVSLLPIQNRGGIGVIAYQFSDHGELTEETHDEIVSAFIS